MAHPKPTALADQELPARAHQMQQLLPLGSFFNNVSSIVETWATTLPDIVKPIGRCLQEEVDRRNHLQF